MRLSFLPILFVGFLCSCCAHDTAPAAAANTGLPDLGAFASHVQGEGLKGSSNVVLYKIDESYDDSLKQLQPILTQAGWTEKQATKNGVRLDGFENPTKGRYALEDVSFDVPNTCTLAYTAAK